MIWAYANLLKTGLISFSEATRFSKTKHEASEAWCKKTDRPHPLHLLYPRTKGFVATVQHLRKAPHVKAVYDFTIAYQHGDRFQKAPSMWNTLSMPRLSEQAGFKFHVHARRFPIESLPQCDGDLAKWLEQRWLEKGEWLEVQRQEWLSKKHFGPKLPDSTPTTNPTQGGQPEPAQCREESIGIHLPGPILT